MMMEQRLNRWNRNLRRNERTPTPGDRGCNRTIACGVFAQRCGESSIVFKTIEAAISQPLSTRGTVQGVCDRSLLLHELTPARRLGERCDPCRQQTWPFRPDRSFRAVSDCRLSDRFKMWSIK